MTRAKQHCLNEHVLQPFFTPEPGVYQVSRASKKTKVPV